MANQNILINPAKKYSKKELKKRKICSIIPIKYAEENPFGGKVILKW